MMHKIKFNLTGVKLIPLLLVVFFSFNTAYAQKTLKVKLKDGTIRHYSVSNVDELTFEADACDGVRTLTYGGKLYSTVQIGTQCWLEQNLNVGDRIAGISEQSNTGTIEKYCYGDQEGNCTVSGGLYQWAEAVQYQDGATNTTSPSPAFIGNIQGICPSGWHIPTNAEFTVLKTAVISDGNKLKSIGQGSDSGVGTNESGFSVLSAGIRIENGKFYFLGRDPYFWSSTETDAANAHYLYLYPNNKDIFQLDNKKINGFSVRCLKD